MVTDLEKTKKLLQDLLAIDKRIKAFPQAIGINKGAQQRCY
jgi:hypothetical protein